MELLAQLEDKYRLPKGLLNAVMTQESGGNVNAVSPKGAQGAFQFMPATAKQYGVDTSSLESSADGAARMYADLLQAHGGDLDKALASYNWGQGNVARKGLDNMPSETRNYIAKVKGNMNEADIPEDEWKLVKPAQVASNDSKWKLVKPASAKSITLQDDLRAELDANPISAKFAAAGTALSDLYQGGKQALGLGNAQDIENNKVIREANPMSALAGNVALFASGGAALPVLNTIKGAAAAGGIIGGLSPVQGENVAQQKIGNALVGAGLGAGITKGVQGISNSLANSKAVKLALQSQNATKDASLKAAQDAGFTIPRSLYKPTFMSNRLESFGGKAAVKQAATDSNQTIVNALARKALGVSDDTPLSIGTIEAVRKSAYKPYEEVAAISKGAANTLDDLKQARADATSWFNSYNRSANPEHLAKAQEFKNVADIADDVLDDYARQAGKPQLISQLKDARKTIAKTYTLERAMNKGSGDIDSSVLARLYDKKKPLSDGLDEIGRFAATFKEVAPKAKSGSGAGISALDATASLALGALGYGYSGNPEGATAGLLPLLLRPASRGLALSKLMQSAPNYSQGLTPMLLEGLLSSRYAPMALTGAAIPSFTK